MHTHIYMYVYSWILEENLGGVGDGGEDLELMYGSLKTIILLLILKRETKEEITLHMSVLITIM